MHLLTCLCTIGSISPPLVGISEKRSSPETLRSHKFYQALAPYYINDISASTTEAEFRSYIGSFSEGPPSSNVATVVSKELANMDLHQFKPLEEKRFRKGFNRCEGAGTTISSEIEIRRRTGLRIDTTNNGGRSRAQNQGQDTLRLVFLVHRGLSPASKRRVITRTQLLALLHATVIPSPVGL